MRWAKRSLLALAAMMIVSPVLAEEMVVCTPEYYYNSSESPPVIVPIDAARAAGSRVTRIDLETGDYTEHFIGSDSDILRTGSLTVVNDVQREISVGNHGWTGIKNHIHNDMFGKSNDASSSAINLFLSCA